MDRNIIGLFPENRKNIIDEAFADTPPELMEAINHYADEMKQIEDTGYTLNEDDKLVKITSHYNDISDTINMNEEMTNAEYAEVFPHELGHYIDCHRGWESLSHDFTEAINNDLALMDKSTPQGNERFHDMLDDAFSTGAAFDRAVSDILSGLFNNDFEIIKRYHDENAAYYSHEDDYWKTPGMIQKEIYANIMAINVGQSRISKNFIERWFGHIDGCFKKKFNLK